MEYVSVATLVPRQDPFQHLLKGCLLASSSCSAFPFSGRWGAHAFYHGHKALLSIFAAWGHVRKPQRQVASFSKFSPTSSSSCFWGCIFSFQLCHSHHSSLTLRVSGTLVKYFQKSGIFSIFGKGWFKLFSVCVQGFVVKISSNKH